MVMLANDKNVHLPNNTETTLLTKIVIKNQSQAECCCGQLPMYIQTFVNNC